MSDHHVEPPNPGIYHDVSMEEYLSWDACSASAINALRKSPAHMKAKREEDPEDETKAQKLGKLIHTAVLEPEKFMQEYHVLEGTCDAVTSSNKMCSNSAKYITEEGQFCGIGSHGPPNDEESGPTVITESEHDTARGIIDSIYEKPKTAEIVSGDASTKEISLVWEDPATGVVCKARIDKDVGGPPTGPPGGAISDLKTARDADSHGFERDAFKYGYHYKSTHYLRGANALGINRNKFIFVAVEKQEPYPCAVYLLPTYVVDTVENRISKLYECYKTVMEAGEFPGFPDGVRDLDMPGWVEGDLDQDFERADEIINSLT